MVLGWSLAAAAMAGLLLVINYYVFVSLRQKIIVREETQLQQVIDVTGVAIDHMFASTRDALESIRSHVRKDTPAINAFELLKVTADAAPFIRALAIMAPDGNIEHSSRSIPPPSVNIAGSPIISHFASGPGAGDEYFIAEPTLNRFDDQWQILSGVPKRDGAGVVTDIIVAVIDTKFIYSELLYRNVGEDGDVILVDRNFHLIAGTPWRDDQIGKSLAASPIFKQLGDSEQVSTLGIVEGATSIGGAITAARWLKDRRFALSASRPLSVALSDWRVLSRVVGGVSAAILLLLVLTGSISIFAAVRRQKQHAALLAIEQRFRLMVDGISDHAIFMLDADGRVSNWNRGAERVTGYDAKTVIGEHFKIFYPPDDQTNLLPQYVLRLATELGVYRTEGWHIRSDGSRYCAAVVTTALRDPSGRLIGFANVTRDISDAKAIHLELNVAKERAEQATAAKAEFLANMSHEIRTPLNGIIGYADLLREDTALTPDSHKKAARIFEAGNALRVIVDDILDLSKIDAHGVALLPSKFSIRDLLDSCIHIVRPAADVKELPIALRVGRDVPDFFVGDALRLRQVLINLLNNAVKFTATGSVTLTLESVLGPNDSAMLQFKVKDTGIGISAEEQQKLFQRFNQANNSTSRTFGGTGLGLSISRHIVHAMHGTIEIKSTFGKGSTFYFSIALPTADEIDPPEGVLVSQNKQSLRILVVDDVEMNRDLCKNILTRAGHRVTLAADALHAIQSIKKEYFDLVLMDIQMPGMDGLEATHQIRLLKRGKGGLPIVALTANVLPDQVTRFKAAGMDGHIAKPIDKTELLQAVSNIVERMRTATLPARQANPARNVLIHDKTALDELRLFTSHAKVSGFARDLKAAVANFPTTWPDPDAAAHDRERLQMAAHKVVALAGQLGFVQLAAACRALEAACLQDRPIPPALDRLRAAVAAARIEIDNIAAMCPAGTAKVAVSELPRM
ncbi:MAG: ATP-binding protein [Pseudolabrys sp.]